MESQKLLKPGPLPDFPGFTTLDDEVDLGSLPIAGEVPGWLGGTLIRIGPAKFEVGETRVTHWFDGLGMLHAFSFRAGNVAYTNRYLRTKAYEAAGDGEFYGKTFETDPCAAAFGRYAAAYSSNVIDNINVNVARLAGQFAALTEQPVAMRFDPRSLGTLGPLPLSDQIPRELSSPHPHFDAGQDVTFNYITRLGTQSSYQIGYIAAGQVGFRRVGAIPTARPSYMHSFAMTENYVILVEFPVIIDPEEFLQSDKSIVASFQWLPEQGTRFLLISKADGTLVRSYEGEPFFAFHHINAFEHGSDILIDITATNTPYETVLGLPMSLEQFNMNRYGYAVRRYRLERNGTGDATYDVLSDAAIELPAINHQAHGARPYRYVYGLGQSPTSGALTRINKIDTKTGGWRSWREKACFPGEPVFVPAPAGRREDDGVILSGVLDARSGRSFLLVLDGHSFTELARAHVPHHIPSDLHGRFFSEAAIASDRDQRRPN